MFNHHICIFFYVLGSLFILRSVPNKAVSLLVKMKQVETSGGDKLKQYNYLYLVVITKIHNVPNIMFAIEFQYGLSSSFSKSFFFKSHKLNLESKMCII